MKNIPKDKENAPFILTSTMMLVSTSVISNAIRHNIYSQVKSKSYIHFELGANTLIPLKLERQLSSAVETWTFCLHLHIMNFFQGGNSSKPCQCGF